MPQHGSIGQSVPRESDPFLEQDLRDLQRVTVGKKIVQPVRRIVVPLFRRMGNHDWEIAVELSLRAAHVPIGGYETDPRMAIDPRQPQDMARMFARVPRLRL